MATERKEYTNDLTTLPHVMALHFSRVMHGKVDLEELESIGNVALVEALSRFLPELSHDGENGKRAFVAQAIRLTMLKHLFPFERHKAARERRMCPGRLFDVIKHSPTKKYKPLRLIDTIGEVDPDYQKVDEVNEFEYIISVIPSDGNYREIIRCYILDGMSYEDLAYRFNVSRQRIGQIMLKVIERLKQFRYRHGDPRKARKCAREVSRMRSES